MILKFSFETISSSGALEKMLLRALEASALEGKLTKEAEVVSLYLKSDEPHLLDKFASKLSQELPHSLFVKNSMVEVVGEEVYPMLSHEIPKSPKRTLPFCPRCLKSARASYDPFTSCEVCGYGVKRAPLHFKNFAKESIDTSQEIFQALATVIKNGAIAKVKTLNGIVLLGLPNASNLQKTEDDYTLLCVDLASVYALSDISQSEMFAIASFEKPVLTLLPNRKCAELYPHIQKSSLKVKMSDDLILELLCAELQALDIKHVFIAKDDHAPHAISLDFEGETPSFKPLEAMVLSQELSVVTKGERGILPLSLSGVGEEKIVALSHDYMAVNENDLITVTTYESLSRIAAQRLFRLESMPETSPKSTPYAACHGAFYSVMAQNGLLEKTVLGLYFSKAHTGKIMLYSPKFGLVDYILFSCAYQNSQEVFEAITHEGESAKALVENFQNRYPISKNLHVDFKPRASEIFQLWGIIAIMLGMYEGDDMRKAGQKVLDEAFSFRGTKGPRIDYKLRHIGDKPALDPLMVIRTAMSFKLAGIDDPTLCFGIVESFAEFLSATVDEVSHDYEIKGVCVAGSLFASKNLLEKFYHITQRNFSLYFNKEMALDEMNLGYGIIHASV